jgi:hypothetical protein
MGAWSVLLGLYLGSIALAIELVVSLGWLTGLLVTLVVVLSAWGLMIGWIIGVLCVLCLSAISTDGTGASA